MIKKQVSFKNKSVYFNFEILEKYTAGLILKGCEVKPIILGNFDFSNSFIFIKDNSLLLKNIIININNYSSSKRNRDIGLLLKKKEMERISFLSKKDGLTIVPLRIFKESRFIKIEIALAKGLKLFDKRYKLKEKSLENI